MAEPRLRRDGAIVDVRDGARRSEGPPDPWRPTGRQRRFAAIFLLWAAAMFATCWLLGSERVPAGTVVAGFDVGGLERESAIDALNQSMGAQSRSTMKLRIGDDVARVSASDLGVVLDAESTIDRIRSRRLNPFDVFQNWLGGEDHLPVVRVDQAVVQSELRRLTRDVGDAMVEPRVVFEGGKPAVKRGRAGQVLDEENVVSAIAAGFPGRKAIDLPTRAKEPSVSDAAAFEVARSRAAKAISAPMVLMVAGRQVTVSMGLLARTLTYEVRDGALQPQLDGHRVKGGLAAELASLETPVRDATWDVSDGKPVLIPSQDGLVIKEDALAAAVIGALDREGVERVASMELVPVRPKNRTDDVAALGITERMASFTQEFPYAPYRVQNIGLAARKVDGTVLKPGATFSLNDIVGERTAEAGFAPGIVIGSGGRFKEDLGGGVSTAATAIWTAAFFAGLERVEQGAHMFWISRYQPGLEATVYWGQLDLKFRNDTATGVLITAKTTDTSITVSVWGKKQADKIEARSGKRENLRPFTTTTDPSSDCVEQSGVDGFDIWVDRVFIRGGEEVKKERFNTHYVPSNAVRCTAPAPASTPTPAARPSPEPGPSG